MLYLKIAVGRAMLSSILAILLGTATYAFYQAEYHAKEYYGKLASKLTAGQAMGIEKAMTIASEDDRKLLPHAPKAEDEVFIGTLHTLLKRQLQIALVRAKDTKHTLYVDSNFDGIFDEIERQEMLSPEDEPLFEAATTVFLNISQGPFASYPVRIAIVNDRSNSGKVLPASSMWVHARGIVNIDGRNILVSYPFDPATGILDPNYGWLGMDCNGDGKIEETSNSPEWKFVDHEIVGFRVAERYLSTQSVDSATGQVILRSLPALEYTDIELVLGKQIPDFAFTEFSGKQRRISDFTGKYVLMDFWATWCAPCVAEIPFLRSAHEKFRARGLEIVGINHDDDLDRAKKLAKEKGISWPQATHESVKNRFRVYAYPTHILLDPDGKIISLGKKSELRGQNLEKTLEKLLLQKQP